MERDFIITSLNSEEIRKDFIFGLCMACSVGKYIEECPFKKIQEKSNNKQDILTHIDTLLESQVSELIKFHFYDCPLNNASNH